MKVDPSPVKPSDDGRPGPHDDCNLVRDPVQRTVLRYIWIFFWTEKSSEIIIAVALNHYILVVIYYIAIGNKYFPINITFLT